MKDIRAHEYADLLAFQKDHLAIWKKKLQPETFEQIAAYCLRTNRPAASEQGKHEVYRGGDITGIIMQWPDLASYYKPVAAEPAEEDLV